MNILVCSSFCLCVVHFKCFTKCVLDLLVFLTTHSPKFLLKHKTYTDRLLHDMNSLSQPREIGVYELLPSVINLPIHWLANTCDIAQEHELRQLDLLFLEKKSFKDFSSLFNSSSILIIMSNIFLIFLNILIIASLKPLCAYFSTRVICVCFH